MSVQETVNVTVESGAVTATSSVGICHGLAGEYKLIGLTMVPQAALAADGSNKYVISVVQGSTSVATSLDSSSAAHVAQTAQACNQRIVRKQRNRPVHVHRLDSVV